MANQVWDILAPEVSTNYVKNPVASNGTTDWTVAGGTSGGAISVDTTPGNILFDNQVIKFTGTTVGAGRGPQCTLSQALANATTQVSVWCYGAVPTAILLGGTSLSPNTLRTEGTYTVYGATFTGGQASGVTTAQVGFAAGALTVYVYIQVEQSSTYTTFIWGDGGPGYVWNGTRGQYSSTRYMLDQDNRTVYGGSIVALDDRVNVVCETMVGVGLLPLTIETQALAGETPALFINHDLKPRDIQLSLAFGSTSLAQSHTRRAAILAVLRYGREFWLRYNGANVTLQIRVAVAGPFDLDVTRTRLGRRTLITLTAQDPKFQYIYQETVALTFSSSPSSSYARLRTDVDGWAAMSSGLFAQPRRAVQAPDGTIYVGTLASGGSAKLQKWTGSSWTDVGGAYTGSITGGPIIYDLVPNADWTKLYVIGDYTTVGGVAGFGGVAAITLSSGAAAKLGTGASGGAPLCGVYIPSLSRLYVGGLHATNMGGVANTSYFCYWDGAAWQSVGSTRPTAGVYTMIADPQANIYLGGDFTNAFALANVSAPTNTLMSGGSVPANTYKAYVLAGDGTGTPDYVGTSGGTVHSNVGHTTGAMAGSSVTTTASNQSVLVTWTAVPGAQYYSIFLTTGVLTSSYLAAVVPGTLTSYAVTSLLSTSPNGVLNTASNGSGGFGSRVVKYQTPDGGWVRLAQMSGGFNGIVRSLAFAGHSGTLIAGGDFTSVDSATANRVAYSRGKKWLPLGDTGMNAGSVFRVKYDNNTVYAVGSFASADGDTAAALLARLDGFPTGNWTHMDVALTNSSNNAYDVIKTPYYVAVFDDTSYSSAAGVTSVTYAGTANLYPKIVVTGPGTFRGIWTQLGRIVMNYALQTGEVVVIDCDKRKVTSTIYGDITYKVHPGSSFDAFYLPAASTTTLFTHAPSATSVNLVGNRQLITADV